MEPSTKSINEIREFISIEENLIAIADCLLSSKGPTKYDVIEIIQTEEGHMKKRARCSKGKHIDAWFREEENRNSAKLPPIAEEDVNAVIKMIIEQMIESKLLHVSQKPDNARRIIRVDSVSWDIHSIYTWEYDGPAGMKYMKMALTLLAVIAIPTYRIWPRFLQNIVFYLLLALLIAMFALEAIRYLLFCICYLFGYRIWLFPDLDRDDKGILGVFTPFITVEKIEDGYNKYRYAALGVLVALLAMYASNPRVFVKNVVSVYDSGVHTVQRVNGLWVSCKLKIVNLLKSNKPVKTTTSEKKSHIPAYDPEEDALYDFTDENVAEEDLMDLEDLEDIKLEVE